MDDIAKVCQKLNHMIRESAEYQMYITARNNLKANEQLYNSLMDFKNRYSDVLKYTDGNPYDEIIRIYYENDDLIHNSIVNEYLRAESALSKLLRDVISGVMDDINY